MRIRFQYSIRFLLTVTLLVAIASSFLAVRLRAAREQSAAVAAMRRYANVAYDYEFKDEDGAVNQNAKPPWPEWARRTLGDDFFFSVRAVYQGGVDPSAKPYSWPERDSAAGPEDSVAGDRLAPLASLRKVRYLFMDNSDLDDAALAYVEDLRDLEQLHLSHTNVTGRGLRHLASLRKLQVLDLETTDIDDDGVECLAHLTNLRELILDGRPRITDRACPALDKLINLECLSLDGSDIGDAGLRYLTHLTKLKWITLTHTRVTSPGAAELRRALPNCEVVIEDAAGPDAGDARGQP